MLLGHLSVSSFVREGAWRADLFILAASAAACLTSQKEGRKEGNSSPEECGIVRNRVVDEGTKRSEDISAAAYFSWIPPPQGFSP